MRFFRHIYVSDALKHKVWKIKWKLKHHKHMISIYVIVLPEDSDELEFYHCEFLQQNYYKRKPPYIVGIADGWEEACRLVGKIMLDSYRKHGNYHVAEFIRNQSVKY